MASLQRTGRPFVRRATRRFALRVALPAILIFVITSAAVFALLGRLAGEANRVDHAATALAADAAVHSLLTRLGSLGRHADDATVAALGGEFIIPSRHLGDAAQSAGLSLRDPGGEVVAALDWTDRNPGGAALASARPLLAAALALLGVTLT